MKKIDVLEGELKKQVNENKDMEKSKKTIEEKIRTLHTEVLETKINAKSDLIVNNKTLNKDIKYWKKELGKEKRLTIKLKAKLAVPSNSLVANNDETTPAPIFSSSDAPSADIVSCTICAEMIPHYIPRFFNGIEMNEACDECQKSSSDSDVRDQNHNLTASANIPENNNYPSIDTKTVSPFVPPPAKASFGFPPTWLTPPPAPPEFSSHSPFH